MAGYMTKLQGYVYDGEHVAATALVNGNFVYVDSDNKAAPIAAETDVKLRVKALEGPYGMTGLRLVVAEQGDNEVFLVENLPEGEAEYDETTYGPAIGEYARIHRLLAGEELLVSLTSIVGINVGDVITIGASAGAFPAAT